MEDKEDCSFEEFTGNPMSSPLNEEDQQNIEEMKTGLKNKFKKCPSSSTSTSNNLSQENVGDKNNMKIQQPFEPINDDKNSSTNSNPNYMDVDDICKIPEQIYLNVNAKTNNEQHFDNINKNNDHSNNTIQHDKTSHPLTTNNTYTGEQRMNALEYYRQLFEQFTSTINTLEPVLVKLTIPAKTGDSYLKSLSTFLPDELDTIAQDPLNKLSNFLKAGINLFSSFRQICNTDLVGEESGEIAKRAISEENKYNGNHLNQKTHASTQTDILVPCIPKDICLATLSLSLSQLLSQARYVVQELELVELKIVEQPQEFWRKRSINCLRNKWCPAIQGRSGKQRRYIGIKWPKLTDCNPNTLFILVQLLSFDDKPHPSNILVPAGTRVKLQESFEKKRKNDNIRPKLDDLIIEENHGFDKKTKAILCPVTEKEYKECKKNLKVIMFRLYKTSEEIGNSDDEESEENENNEEDISIEEQLNKLSKLRICLCRQTDKGELEYVSNFVVTDLIEESKGNKTLAVDPSEVTPKNLCNCGNETITVPFNTDSEKYGLIVHLNDKKLDAYRIRGVQNKQIFFDSHPNTTSGQNYLNVKVSKKSISETIKQNHDPYNGLDENILLNMNINYVEKNENPHVHKPKFSIQSNEISQTKLLI